MTTLRNSRRRPTHGALALSTATLNKKKLPNTDDVDIQRHRRRLERVKAARASGTSEAESEKLLLMVLRFLGAVHFNVGTAAATSTTSAEACNREHSKSAIHLRQ